MPVTIPRSIPDGYAEAGKAASGFTAGSRSKCEECRPSPAYGAAFTMLSGRKVSLLDRTEKSSMHARINGSSTMKTLARIPSHKVLSLLVLSMVSLHQASGETSSWTGWLGPGQAARGQGFETPDTWPEELDQHWRVEVGEGYSTPLVVGN